MPSKLSSVVNFPNEFPRATTGVFLPDEGVLFTGHENGFVVKWRVRERTYDILHECSSTVESISTLSNKEVIVGCHSGLLFTFPISDPKKKRVIQEASGSVFSRVWRVAWPEEKRALSTSTYGVLTALTRTETGWESSRLAGHGNSVFALGTMDGRYLASGDFRGKIIIWEKTADGYNQVDQLSALSAVEGLAWSREGALAAIDMTGRIYFFESAPQENNWRSVFETDVARSQGTCIHVTEDGKTVFAGSHTDLIQFDLETHQFQLIHMIGIRKIFSKKNTIFVLTTNALVSFERIDVSVSADHVKYQYAKVSLIGRTHSGKSTLASLIVTGSIDGIKSTFGKRIWTWTIPNGSPEKRIVFHDHGGQETVLGTFIPFLADSDIVLVFFKQTDKTTYDRALQILQELESVVARRTKIFFVQTFVDNELNEVAMEEGNILELIKTGKIVDRLEICPPSGVGVEDFKARLKKEISWDNARTIFQSVYAEGVSNTILELLSKDARIVDLESLKKQFESLTGLPISTGHLKFLLKNFSSQGLIEYYPEVLDAIILNDSKYNKLRTEVPIFVEYKKGLTSIRDIEMKFGQTDLVRVLDQVYLSFGVCIENRDLRIFPQKLKGEPVSIPEPYKHLLATPIHREEREFPPQRIIIDPIIKALSELKMGCIDASKNEGVFAWETNACIYYRFQESGDAIAGQRIRFTYVIGGQKETTSDRLLEEFTSILERLYGPSLQTVPDLKKNDANRREFDVALSFAGEQRDYVRKVAAVLESKGLKVFYDEFYKSQLWGKDLGEYLQQVYSSRARWCIMFISKEYLAKMWPSHERHSAVARQVKQIGEYILPVIFDDGLDVPGVNFTIGYQDARRARPEQIAELFLQKLEHEGT
jgi:hypothetical protein